MPGTQFLFHHATDYFCGEKLRDHKLSQLDYRQLMDNLKQIDAMQLLFFTKRGRPIKTIFELFGKEASLNVAKAERIKLVQGVFSIQEFKRIRAMLYASKS